MISNLTTLSDWLSCDWLSVIDHGRCQCRIIVNRRRQLTLLRYWSTSRSGRLLPLASVVWRPGRRAVHVAAVQRWSDVDVDISCPPGRRLPCSMRLTGGVLSAHAGRGATASSAPASLSLSLSLSLSRSHSLPVLIKTFMQVAGSVSRCLYFERRGAFWHQFTARVRRELAASTLGSRPADGLLNADASSSDWC